jgi:hypothetical protein
LHQIPSETNFSTVTTGLQLANLYRSFPGSGRVHVSYNTNRKWLYEVEIHHDKLVMHRSSDAVVMFVLGLHAVQVQVQVLRHICRPGCYISCRRAVCDSNLGRSARIYVGRT